MGFSIDSNHLEIAVAVSVTADTHLHRCRTCRNEVKVMGQPAFLVRTAHRARRPRCLIPIPSLPF